MARATATGGASTPFDEAFSAASRACSAFEAWQRFVYMAAYEIALAFRQDVSPFSDVANSSRKAAGDDFPAYADMMSSMVEALERDPFQDFLGSAFMRLGIGNEAGGQFFTPFNISHLMGRIVLDAADGGVIRVGEPACGAGANCIAVCKALGDRGIDWQRRVLFECQDVSEMTALMCYVQLSLIGAAAKVTVGDTLRMESRYTLRTPVLATEPCWVLGAIRGEW